MNSNLQMLQMTAREIYDSTCNVCQSYDVKECLII